MSERIRLGFAFGCLLVIGLSLPDNLREWRGFGLLSAASSTSLGGGLFGPSLPRALFGKAALRAELVGAPGEPRGLLQGDAAPSSSPPPAPSPDLLATGLAQVALAGD